MKARLLRCAAVVTGAALSAAACGSSETATQSPPSHGSDAGSHPSSDAGPDAAAASESGTNPPVDAAPDALASDASADAVDIDGAVDGPSQDAPDAASTDGALAALTVSFDGFTLAPAFSPGVHDYAIRCAAGANATVVRAAAPPGLTVSMLQPQAVSLSQPAPVSLAPNEAVVVEATSGDGGVDDYWIRCLPPDFPQIAVARYGKTTPGWYVTGNTSVASGEAGYAMVLDGNGTPVWYRATAFGTTPGLVDVITHDTIAYIGSVPGRFGTDPNGHFDVLRLDDESDVTWATSGSATDEHEFLPLPNGDAIMLSYPATPGIDMSSRGVTNTTTIADCSIQEIAPDGSLVWSWLGSDHMDVVQESTEFGLGTIGGVNVIDPFHCNSVDVTPSGDLLVSVRQIDAVILISRDTGQIEWKLGGVPYNKDGAELLEMQGDPEGSFYHQHDARLLPNGDISLYDDHTTTFDTQMPAPNVARGMEIDVDVGQGIGTVVFQYQATLSSSATGSFRRYSDGSSVVGWGFLGSSAPALAMTELDNVGNSLLEMSFVLGDHTYRVLKVPTSSLDLGVMRQTAGASASPGDGGASQDGG
jgi:hypothetical protein